MNKRVPIHSDANGVLTIAVMGGDSEGHDYIVNASGTVMTVNFQNGPVRESGVNGMTNEALLAILIHRTKYLNDQFPCRENALAITKMEEALMWFEKRTADRMKRGVEGLNQE